MSFVVPRTMSRFNTGFCRVARTKASTFESPPRASTIVPYYTSPKRAKRITMGAFRLGSVKVVDPTVVLTKSSSPGSKAPNKVRRNCISMLKDENEQLRERVQHLERDKPKTELMTNTAARGSVP